ATGCDGNRSKIMGELATQCFWMFPEVGYSFRNSGQGDVMHLSSLGFGIGYGGAPILGLYTPRFVVGKFGTNTAVAFRHGISGRFLATLLSVELSHQMVSAAGELTHELSLTVGINAGAPLFTGVIR